MKLHLIVGARPNFMKIAPLYKEFAKYKECFEVKLVHTGQHYDEKMSKIFFDELELPVPDIFLGVGSGSHGYQTAKIMELYEKVLLNDQPDWIIVAGDVNSTIACALDAVKLHIKVAHLEAGLRSFDRSMPEEINRLATDAISDLLLIPSEDAEKNLLLEGNPKDKIHFVGNIMIDSVVKYRNKAEDSNILNILNDMHHSNLKAQNYVLITLHRPSNVDNKESLKTILEIFKEISSKVNLVFPAHPRTIKNIHQFQLDYLLKDIQNLTFIEPLGYLDFMYLQMKAKFILTDSGGIQEESTFFGIPCLTLRDNTERPMTVTTGTNQLIPLEKDKILEHINMIFNGKEKKGMIPELWDGNTAERVVNIFRKMKEDIK